MRCTFTIIRAGRRVSRWACNRTGPEVPTELRLVAEAPFVGDLGNGAAPVLRVLQERVAYEQALGADMGADRGALRLKS